MVPIVNVRAADACVIHSDKNIVGRRELWYGALSKLDLVGFVEKEGEVL